MGGDVLDDAALVALAERVAALGFALSGGETDRRRAERDRVARLLRGVVARTAEPRAPLLVVVGGGSGAGKSTTVNTLAGAVVSRSGVIRPTTRAPILVCHPDDRAWFEGARPVPDVERTVESAALPAGVALLDTPDIDSVELTNHRLADESLDAADVWLWFVTARTYADEVGMRYLRRARTRQALTVVALTQVHDRDRDEVLADAARLLAEEGVVTDLLLAIPYAEVTDERLPVGTVARLETWLRALAPPERRIAVRERAAAGLRSALPTELALLDAAIEDERRVAARLVARVDHHYGTLPDRLTEELDRGLSMRAEVLDRWQRLVGGNETMLRVQTVLGQVGELVRTGLGRDTPSDTRQVRVEVAGELTRIVSRLLEQTATSVRRELEADPRGRALLDAVGTRPADDLRRVAPGREAEVRRMVAGWEVYVSEQIETVGGPRMVQARRRSTALNAVATSAILVLFAVSGGLTGGEVGIAAAAAAASQWLLVKMLGEHNVSKLLVDIGEELVSRVVALAAIERERVDALLAAATPPATTHDAIRTLTRTTA